MLFIIYPSIYPSITGMHFGSRCFWDSNTDNHASDNFSNVSQSSCMHVVSDVIDVLYSTVCMGILAVLYVCMYMLAVLYVCMDMLAVLYVCMDMLAQ